MKDCLSVLKERRSVKKYKDEYIDEAILDKILEAGTYAPTGRNRQVPVIVAIKDRAVRDKISKMNAEILGNPDIDPFYGAPTIILVLTDPSVSTAVEDASLVLGNLMHAACALGVDSCWIHRAKEEFNSQEGKAMLREWGLDESLVGVGHLAIGYRDCEYPKPSPRKENYIIKI